MIEYLMFGVIIWIVGLSHFFFVFFKNESDFDRTISFYKNIFKKGDKTEVQDIVATNNEEEKNIDKKNDNKNVVDNEVEEITKKRDPYGFPIDLSLSNDLYTNEAILKQKILKERFSKGRIYSENGETKLIVPMEALLFLNKGYNPLVNEEGEILISYEENETVVEIKEIIESLRDSSDSFGFSNEDIVNSLRSLVLLSRDLNLPIKDIAEKFKDKLNEKVTNISSDIDTNLSQDYSSNANNSNDLNQNLSNANEIKKKSDKVVEVIPEAKDIEEKIEKEKIEEIEEDTTEIKSFEKKPFNDKNKVIVEDIKDNNIEDTKEESKIKIDLGDLEEFENNELEDNEVNNEVQDIDLSTLTNQIEGSDKEFDKEKYSDSSNIGDFLDSIMWKDSDTTFINFNSNFIKSDMETYLSTGDNMKYFLTNIVKQQPLVKNDNKTSIFIDIKILVIALARLSGNEYDTNEKILSNIMTNQVPKRMNDIKIALIIKFKELDKDCKKFVSGYFEENDTLYKGYGVWLNIEVFKKCFTEEEYDFFRSFSRNSKIRVTSSQRLNEVKDSDKGKQVSFPPLINTINDTKI